MNPNSEAFWNDQAYELGLKTGINGDLAGLPTDEAAQEIAHQIAMRKTVAGIHFFTRVLSDPTNDLPDVDVHVRIDERGLPDLFLTEVTEEQRFAEDIEQALKVGRL